MVDRTINPWGMAAAREIQARSVDMENTSDFRWFLKRLWKKDSVVRIPLLEAREVHARCTVGSVWKTQQDKHNNQPVRDHATIRGFWAELLFFAALALALANLWFPGECDWCWNEVPGKVMKMFILIEMLLKWLFDVKVFVGVKLLLESRFCWSHFFAGAGWSQVSVGVKLKFVYFDD